ncbi:hypothetical protein N7454_003866 [Penicillium verhagenii]|nr:hypothetical protein N7454_003866 [Penicillium verhagenii]
MSHGDWHRAGLNHRDAKYSDTENGPSPSCVLRDTLSVQKLDTTVTATGPALQPPAAAPIPLPPLRGCLAPRSRSFSPVRSGDENKNPPKRARA